MPESSFDVITRLSRFELEDTAETIHNYSNETTSIAVG